MALRSIRLNLALLALASSSGYLLFYLAPDSASTLLSRETARWNRFVIEAPSNTASANISKLAQRPSPKPRADNHTLVLSGHQTHVGVAYPSAGHSTAGVTTTDGEAAGAVPPALSKPAVTEPNPAFTAVETEAPPAEMSAKTGGVALIITYPSKTPSSSAKQPESLEAFIDTGLLVTGMGNNNNPSRRLSPTSNPNRENEENYIDLTHAPWRTTAGRFSPGESLGNELNLATRGYIANTDDIQYQLRMGFVVDQPDIELMIYALGTNLRDKALPGPELPPSLQIYDAAGELVARSEALQPEQSMDPAVIHVFSPGVYQIVVTAAEGSAGEVVVGVKDFYSVEVE